MFQIGEYIIYGANGVCKVKEIGNVKIGNHKSDKIFYTLEPVFSKGSTVYTPVDSEKVIMRRLITKEDAKKLIDDIDNIEFFWVSNDKQREQTFKEAIRKYDCREWIKVIKTLYLRKQERIAEGKKITTTDEKYLHAAEENLYCELSMALEMPKDEIQEYIAIKVKSLEEESLRQ